MNRKFFVVLLTLMTSLIFIPEIRYASTEQNISVSGQLNKLTEETSFSEQSVTELPSKKTNITGPSHFPNTNGSHSHILFFLGLCLLFISWYFYIYMGLLSFNKERKNVDESLF
ncbi:hypothetical protein C6N01_13145 [Enterococcus faecalis]|uniref:hypothetical protein n=1 Tax=Enterococcus faecalis TaxID=1351 RepID=UPI00136218FF|nr:hypothetical protein [Enterococcus faecalis]NBJ47153.1 hypothetical protein [Enterococcus faecalis]